MWEGAKRNFPVTAYYTTEYLDLKERKLTVIDSQEQLCL